MMDETMKNFLCDREKKLEAMLAVVRDVQGGKSLAGACKEHGASYQHVYALLKSASLERMWGEIKPLYENVDFDPTPCEEFYRLVFGDRLSDSKLPPDAEETVEYLMSAKLTEREISILRDRTGLKNEDGMVLTFDEVAHKRGLTKERIRQIELRALRRLRHPETLRILALGLDGYEKQAEVARLEAENEKRRGELEIMRLEKELADMLVQEEAYELNEQERELMVREARGIFGEVMSIGVMDLNLSVRSFNCLRRGGFDTVGKIIACKDLMRIRNLGRKSLDEIVCVVTGVLNEQGYTWEQAREMMEAEDLED